jgi:hypothetical protein
LVTKQWYFGRRRAQSDNYQKILLAPQMMAESRLVKSTPGRLCRRRPLHSRPRQPRRKASDLLEAGGSHPGGGRSSAAAASTPSGLPTRAAVRQQTRPLPVGADRAVVSGRQRPLRDERHGPGTNVMISEIFSPKNSGKNWRFRLSYVHSDVHSKNNLLQFFPRK